MTLPTWPYPESPFHAGEREAQRRAGKAEQVAAVGNRLMRAEMVEQHRQFFAQLPFLVAGAVDAVGTPWASLLTGEPGFAYAPDPHHLRIDTLPAPHDPLWALLEPGHDVGLLGIELPTRRRNRLNGIVTARDAGGLTVAVRQSFGNCPRYIQQRELLSAAAARPAAPVVSDRLDAASIGAIAGADTLFIATHHADADTPQRGGADVSHRGGNPGFVRVEQGTDGAAQLLMPDYNGNNYFNTVGNLLANPRAGLLFVDFEQGDLLHVAVRVEVLWEGPLLRAHPGAERVLRMTVERMVRRAGVLPWRGALRSVSAVLQGIGPWLTA